MNNNKAFRVQIQDGRFFPELREKYISLEAGWHHDVLVTPIMGTANIR